MRFFLLALLFSCGSIASGAQYTYNPQITSVFRYSPVPGVGCFIVTNNSDDLQSCRLKAELFFSSPHVNARRYGVSEAFAVFDSYDEQEICLDFAPKIDSGQIWDNGIDSMDEFVVEITENTMPRLLAFCYDDDGIRARMQIPDIVFAPSNSYSTEERVEL